MATIERSEDIAAWKQARALADSIDVGLGLDYLPEAVFRRRLGALMGSLKGFGLSGPNFNSNATRPRLGTWDLEPETL